MSDDPAAVVHDPIDLPIRTWNPDDEINTDGIGDIVKETSLDEPVFDLHALKEAAISSLKPLADMQGMAQILALTPVPSIVLDTSLTIVEVSKSYLKLATIAKDECLGQNIYEFVEAKVRVPDVCSVRHCIDRAVESKDIHSIEGIHAMSARFWHLKAVPIFDEEELLYIVLEAQETTHEHSQQADPNDESYKNETYRILVNHVKDYAIFMIDTQGCITTWNSGASILKQYTVDEIVGKHFSIFYDVEDNANGKPQKELKICLRDGKVEDEGWRYKKDGTRFWASVTIAPMYRAGQHIGFSKVTRDLTERKAAETRLIAAFEEASQLKSDFLANMSHEIRTPMHGMLVAANLLNDTHLTAEQRELAQIIEESGSILLQVINDILDYSKLASGSFTVSSSRISILDITSAVVKASQATMRPGIVLETVLDANIPHGVQSDPLRYRQVLQNLVGNAIKFTETGSIRIRTSKLKEDSSAVIALTEVIDTGIGVPLQAVEALFTPFSQFDSSATKRYKGTGLGLSICKSLVELMGGAIGFNPNPDKGSTFWFTTRLSKSDDNALITSPSSAPSKKLSESILAKQLLVVEDNAINQTIMVKLLQGYGFGNIDVALNGDEGVKLVKTKPLKYGLILMDINMPVMDGIAATKAIRDLGLDLPIIAMTANALKGDEEQYLEQGLNDYISKPVDRRMLLRTLLKWLQPLS